MALCEQLLSFPPGVYQARVFLGKAAQSSVDLTRSIMPLTDKLLQAFTCMKIHMCTKRVHVHLQLETQSAYITPPMANVSDTHEFQ